MISLKRYLDSSSGESYLRMLGLLADTATQQPVDIDHAQCELFKSEVAHIQARFTGEAKSEHLPLAAGAIGQALAAYNQSVSDFVRRQGSELQTMISMLTATILSLGSASELSTQEPGRHRDPAQNRLRSGRHSRSASAPAGVPQQRS